MGVAEAELITMQRSAGMQHRGEPVKVEREVLIEMIEELLETRRLVSRLGADLTTVARRRQSS